MNQIHSKIPAFWHKVSGVAFLLSILLAEGSFCRAQARTHAQHGVKLRPEEASKLLISGSSPKYPVIAKVNYVRGKVVLRIRVNAKGKVVAAHVVNGEPLLAAAALKAIRDWRYKPYMSPKGPEGFKTDAILSFALQPFRIKRHLPAHADKYLKKQVRPPKVLAHPEVRHPHQHVKFKLLVGAKGEVLDAVSESRKKSEVDLALENLEHWKFRPARWGALPVPWYLTVKVPLGRPSADPVNDSGSH